MSQPEPRTATMSAGRAFLVYTLLRLVLLVVSVGLLALIGLRGLLLVGAAVLLSALLSVVLLRRQREAFTNAAVVRAQHKREQREQRRARLDQDPAEPEDPGPR